MVFKKRSNRESNGFSVQNIPRAPRSCRRKGLFKRTDADGHICAFELLASLAGKLLQESESSSASTNAFGGDKHSDIGKGVKQEQLDDCKPLKTEFVDQGCSESKSTNENASGKCLLNEFPFFEPDGILERTLVSGYFKSTSQDLNPVGSENKQQDFNFPNKIGGGFTGESCDIIVNHGLERQREKTDNLKNADLAAVNMCHLDDTTELLRNFPKSRSCRVPVPHASFARHRKDIKLGSRDDDENFYRCYKFSKKFKSYRPLTRIGDWRWRKLFSSKHWKTAPKLKDFEYTRPDGGLKPSYHKRKACYGYNRHQSDTVYKRRKISDRSSVVTFDGGFSSESVSNSPENGKADGLTRLHSKDSHVKFSIKSFKVPELYIEVPETTTIGSLKRTVLEAVTALLGGGMRVGLLVQGKKVRDDNKTLTQTGISCKENPDALGFTLEPGPEKNTPTICSEDPLSLPPDATNVSKGYPVSPVLDSGILSSHPDSHALIDLADHVETDRQLVPYKSETSADGPSDSRALVPVPALSVEALAMIPLNQKPKRSELAQRRTRRPFSVSEVEALVQAVEEVGTGRWRDVKLRAFENADHRTYVDLKDKWKTLVHTASISPQQRRGEPVPQELLDRVLAAHAHWSQHQAKQHGKQQAGCLKITDAPPADANQVGALQPGLM